MQNPITLPCSPRRPGAAFPSLLPLVVLAAALALSAVAAHAANLLNNPSFELNSGRNIPTGWTRFAPPTAQSPPNLWIEGSVTPEDGKLYFKEWGACYNGTNNAAGIYQDFSSAAGSTYQASGWLFTRGTDTLGPDCYVWLEVSFLGSSSNLLALYKSDTFTAAAGTDTWIPYTVNHPCDTSTPVSIGDPFFNTYAPTGTVSQIVAPVGTATVRYRFVYVQYASEGGSCYFDNAVLNQITGTIPPVISSLYPNNMIFVPPGDGISFSVSSPSGFTINSSSIGLILNGTNNVSSSLNITGSASSKTVTYTGLQSNQTYTASITVTDSFNLTASANTYFETTWVGVPPVVYLWEAEDFDFTNGLYYDFPTLCSTTGSPNCYYDTVGTPGTDEYLTGTAPNHVYRPNDLMGTLISGDYSRKDHYLAGVFDYRIDPFNTGSWLNYTRDWSNGTYWVIGRLSTDTGLSGSITLSVVNSDSTTTDLGTFKINGGKGWSTFLNVLLKDTNGNNAVVTLNGKQTLRATSGGNLLPNFFMLVAAQADLPQISQLYPANTPFEYTNTFSFNVTTPGSSFPANGIKVYLDGLDVSSQLQITGSASTKTVVYPSLQLNAIHTAVLTVTNVLGHGISITNHFDTFSQYNYMVEAEEFDYDGGQFIDPTPPLTQPDMYAGQGAVTNVDYQHTSLSGEQYIYRSSGIPTDSVNTYDYLRTNYVWYGGIDYALTFFAGGDWANYTRTYPSGAYNVYIRSSGDGPFSMYLDQVTSGVGTTNQTTQRLGRFGGNGKDYITFDWVPLTDNGLAAPVVVNLNGQSTLRLSTDGFCNPNYFMLVPVAGITLHAGLSANNLALSFPTQNGANYRVFYRTNLVTGSWTQLTTVLGDGTVKTITDPATSAGRYYKVSSP